jgi:hypothetical protein
MKKTRAIIPLSTQQALMRHELRAIRISAEMALYMIRHHSIYLMSEDEFDYTLETIRQKNVQYVLDSGDSISHLNKHWVLLERARSTKVKK